MSKRGEAQARSAIPATARRRFEPRGVGARCPALLLALCNATSVAAAPELDSARAHRFVLTRARLASRTSELELPQASRVRWRVRVPGGIQHPLTVTHDGNILIAHTQPALSQYDAQGRLVWTAQLGANPAAAPPLVLGNGLRGVITQSGEARFFSARGAFVSSWPAPFGPLSASPVIGALRDGGLVLADGRSLARLDAGGALLFSRRLPDETRSLLETPAGVVAVLSSGALLQLADDGQILRSENFGGRVDSAVAIESRILAIVDARRLIEIDLSTGVQTQRVTDLGSDFLGLLAVNREGEVRLMTSSQLLVAWQPDGQQRPHVALAAGGPSATRLLAADLLVDPRGTTWVVRAETDALAASADGTLIRSDATACQDPMRGSALQTGSVVLACRSGSLVRLDDASQRPP